MKGNAFTHGGINRVIDNLEGALEKLPDSDKNLRASIMRILERAVELMNMYSTFSNDLHELRLIYRASYMPSPFALEVDELLEVLARIEAQRRSTGSNQE